MTNPAYRYRLTPEGQTMLGELDYGHNPSAYLCKERPEDQRPVPHELCVLCADGVEALTWKNRAVAAERNEIARLRALGADMQQLCVASIGKMNRAGVVENITKYRAMADAYGNAAELLWAEADALEGDSAKSERLRHSLGLDE